MTAHRPLRQLSSWFLGLTAASLLVATHLASAAPTDLASEPLNNPATSTKPNLLFILDNSGSMAWDFSPDYMSDDSTSEGNFRICFDHRDSSSTDVITTTTATSTASGANLKTCWMGDPPFASPQTNKQYYNPAIRYTPPVQWDNTNKVFAEYPSNTAANTTNWTVVRTDPYNVQNRGQLNGYGGGGSTTNVNLVTGYPDRLWCQNTTDADAACRKNTGAYDYPNHDYGKGKTATSTSKGTIRYTTGAPYYYSLTATEYCSTPDLIVCNTQAAADATYPYAAPVRWCTNAGFTDCQGKRTGSYTYPKFVGTVASSAGTPAVAASGTFTVLDAGTTQTNVDSLTVNGVNIITAQVNSPAGGTSTSGNRSTFAESIRVAINANTGASGYSATRSNNVLTISATTTGPAPNGFAIAATSSTAPVTAAKASFTVVKSVNPSSVSTLTANGVSIIGGSGVSCNTKNEGTCADNIVSAIKFNTGSTGYDASRSGTTVTVTAPLSLGAAANGYVLAGSGSVSTDLSTTFSGGASSATVSYSSTPLSGGAPGIAAFDPVRQNVGAFARMDIIPTNSDGSTRYFPRGDKRTDCVTHAATNQCSYDEEMTNFANWYSYYRTRMQMMKSSTGRSFLPLTDAYRVGFMTINFSSTRYLKVDDFATNSTSGGHKKDWYDKLYATDPTGSTPLREALSRAGWYFAGLTTGLTSAIPTADDPVQFSCQPNFSILSSDGYWNSNAGQDLNGSSMTDQDGSNGGYSLQSAGVYEGATASSDTLADVALYYYKNDLRSDFSDNVKATQKEIQSLPVGTPEPSHQRMITFTMGLGLDGFLSYERNYDDPTKTTGDFYAITQGTKTWPKPNSGTTEDPGKLDDLWHAAVSGRGKFFSASNPEDVVTGLSDALNALQAYTGAGAAAATSNLQPVAGDNFAFTAQYTSVDWTGDVRARTIDLVTGVISNISLWSASALLEAKDWTTRYIYMFDATDTAGNLLKNFCWPGSLDPSCADGAGLSAGEQAYFNTNQLSQYASWTTTQRTSATGETLVNYLRGDTARETTGGTASTDLYRARVSILGDVVQAQPAYVKVPQFTYNVTKNPGYTDYRSCAEGVLTTCPATFPTPGTPRRGTLYIAANDGMLHAFETDVNNDPYYQTAGISTTATTDDTFTGNNAGNGEERWAYIPTEVLPKLHTLANNPYSHSYTVDGSPKVGDVCASTPCAGVADWRTILVAGLNSGGRGYYALDVTNPLAPKALWEFRPSSTCLSDAAANPATIASAAFADCHVGNSYGNALITKRKSDSRWVVIVASGYNNFNPGNGHGFLYILDAMTGAILNRIDTGVGSGGTLAASYSDADPAGLARINGWVDNLIDDNTTLAVYGGDLKGNLWRFNLDSSSANYLTATKLFVATDAGGTAQPITTVPELTEVYGYRGVFFGTGRYVGTSDKSDTQVQSIYAVRDDLTQPAVAGTALITSGRSALVQRTMTAGAVTGQRTMASGVAGAAIIVDWTVNPGWYVDLPDSGERVNVDPILQLGTLVVASNVPGGDPCTAGGYAWLNFLNYKNGGVIPGYSFASVKNSSSVIVGLNQILLPGGKLKIVVTTASNEQITQDAPVESIVFEGRRVGWRELFSDR